MNGIASYANQEMVPPGAIANIRGAADLLERFGREGDIYIVHAAEGETVVPMEVLDRSPNLKKMLFSQMEEMGLRPERYVVGNELNSLNPVTGRPEFFFKKLFKSIKNVFKVAAPILGAIAGSIFAPYMAPFFAAALGGSVAAGAIASSAIASGIGSFAGSKLTGASTSDALKGAAISAGTAGLFKGFTGYTDIGKSLMGGWEENVLGEVGDVFSGDPLSEAASSVARPLTFSELQAPGPLHGLTAEEYASAMGKPVLPAGSSGDLDVSEWMVKPPSGSVSSPTSPDSASSLSFTRPALFDNGAPAVGSSNPLQVPRGQEFMEKPLISRLSSSPGGQRALLRGSNADNLGSTAVSSPEIPTYMSNVRAGNELNRVALDRLPTVTPTRTNISGVSGISDSVNNFAVPQGTGVGASEFNLAGLDTGPTGGFLSGLPGDVGQFVRGLPGEASEFVQENKLSTALALGLAGTAAYDAYKTNEELEEEEEERKKANNLFAQAFRVGAPINLGQNPDFRRPVFAKKGGGIPSKGLGDVVPAMLEPGEFVMTRNAVAGAGNGSQKNGIKRMYSMMKDFERHV